MEAINRRTALALGAAGLAATVIGLQTVPVRAAAADVERLLGEFAGQAEPVEGRVTLTLPAVAENGNAVAVTIEVDSAMEGDDRVERIALFSEGNPLPEVAGFDFTALSGAAFVSTRMRLAQSQTVVAAARMVDGRVFVGRRAVEVTVGGCVG